LGTKRKSLQLKGNFWRENRDLCAQERFTHQPPPLRKEWRSKNTGNPKKKGKVPFIDVFRGGREGQSGVAARKREREEKK